MKMSQYFPKPFEPFGGDINVKVDLSNYATKSDLKNMTHVDVSSFPLKTNLASLKAEVDKLDLGKLTTIPNDLAKLSNVVKYDVVKKAEYKINTAKFGSRTKYEKDGSDFEDKISNEICFSQKTYFNAKITEVENKVPNVSSLVKKTDLDTELKKNL